MALWDRLMHWLAGPGEGRDMDELARRLGVERAQVVELEPSYTRHQIPKRRGGQRQILAPSPPLKAMQRRILRRLLNRLSAHPMATGFERGQSIAINALAHRSRAVVVKMDIRDFFPSTRADRIEQYFRAIGWNREVSRRLTHLCTYEGGLPQGAPTSPRLSNLVNIQLDARLDGLAQHYAAVYTRYADDMTFSFGQDEHQVVNTLIRGAKEIVAGYGYRLHNRKKLCIARACDRQQVTGLVVNAWPALPRHRRRWLRAVEHYHATGRHDQASLTPEQLAGWRNLETMIARQTSTHGEGRLS